MPEKNVTQKTNQPPLMTKGLALVLLAQLCFGYAFSSFLLFPKFLALEMGASVAQIGFVETTNRTAAMVGLFVCGVAVDRYGRRPFLTLGALMMAAASLGFAFVDEIGAKIYFLRAFQGIAFAMTFTAGAALVVDLAPPKRLAQAIGYFGLTMLSMNAVAPAVVEFLAESVGWEVSFFFAALGALLCAGVSLWVRDPERTPVSPGDVPGIFEVARQPKQIRAAVVIGIVGAAFAAMFVLHQPFAIELGVQKLRGFFIAYTLVAVTIRLGFGGIADRVGRHRVARISLAVYAVSVVSMAGLEWISLLLLGAALGLAHGFFYPSYNAMAVEEAGEHERGKIMAIFQGWFSAGGAIGTLGLGLLADTAGYPVVFLVAGAATFGALGVLLWPFSRTLISRP
jgi:MFS family permease